jgi:hypothetical protein
MSLRIATGVYVVMGMIKVAAELIISKLVAPELPVRVVLAAIVFLATTSIAGWVAARIRPGSTIFLALIVMITVAVLTAVKICAVPVAWWYPFGFLTLGPLSVLFTPAVFARRSRCCWLSGKSSGGGATRKQTGPRIRAGEWPAAARRDLGILAYANLLFYGGLSEPSHPGAVRGLRSTIFWR